MSAKVGALARKERERLRLRLPDVRSWRDFPGIQLRSKETIKKHSDVSNPKQPKETIRKCADARSKEKRASNHCRDERR